MIIFVKNKLFGSVKKPHELMHQPDIYNIVHVAYIVMHVMGVKEG
jgi:hypothetical protein